jgi:hypothetical protein
MKMENIQHPTSNIQHPMGLRRAFHWMLDVGCWMLDVPNKAIPALHWLKDFLDYLGGSRETPPAGPAFVAWRGLWWGLLAGLILLFCGQTSNFIYIDF